MYRRLPLVVTGGLLLTLLTAGSAAAAQPGMATPAPSTSQMLSQPATADRTATGSAAPAKSLAPAGTAPYALDFTMPTLGKSGCMVCHGDPNLIRIKGDEYVSYYVSEAVLNASAHGPSKKTPSGVLCTGCHLDFASTGKHSDADWKRTARMACRACHTLEDDAYGKGAHAVNNRPGQTDPNADKKPLCGDCHGAHDIARLDANGLAALHRNGWQVCGRCHQKEWQSYADYYHGAAYKKGAPDAPACWDCHGAHEILPSSDRRSPTNGTNLAATCGGETAGKKCHTNVNDEFLSYAGLIHRRAAMLRENWLYSFIRNAQTGISDALSNIADAVRSWFG